MKRLVSLVLAFIFVIQTVLAVQCPHEDITLKKWSDPVTWTGLTAPATNAEVTIPSGLHVLMDDPNPPTLRGITIANGGSLTWDLKPIQLNVSHIMVQGLLQIGSEECPFDEKTVITLEDEQISVDTRVGMKVIGVLEGGSLKFYGKVHSPVWTRLDGTATKGSKSITLRDAVTWQANDTIVLAPTNYDPEEAETVEIESVSQDGKTVTLKSALQYDHFGLAPASNSGFEERAEVGVLDRYIKVQGNEASEKDGFGGHTMCIANYTMANFVGVEFTRMGQRGVLARYPVHYHVVEFGRFLVNDNSFHYNYQRCVTLHSSSNLHVINNLCYDVEGHAMFIEDGFDTGALLKDNLIIKVRAGTLQPHDVYASSGFFLTGPNNTIIGNQVSGAAGNGYWYSAPVELIGPSHTTYAMAHPYRTQLGIFENNNARTIQQNGLFVDLGADMNNNPVVQGYDPRVDAMNNASEPVLATFNTFQATKCQMYGAHTRGGYHAIVDAKIASSFGGVRFANAPFSTARQTMTRGLIQRVTQNSPTSVPNSSGTLAGLPQRGIVPYGGPNKFQQVSLKGFNLPAGACIGPHGREPLSAGNLISGIDCAGQSLFYVSADAKQTDNEKMFATIYVADSKESQLVVKNDFMTLPSSKCKSHDQNTLLCTSGSIGSVNIYDDDVANTKIPAPLKPDDVHATIYRLNSNLKTIKSEIDIVGYSDPDKKTQKKTVYPLNVPITETDAYGVVFTHQTPAKLRIAIDHVASSSFTTIGLCYPAGSVIQSVKLADGTPLTAADSDTQLKGNKGSMYLMDSVEGRLVLPVVSKSNSAPTEYIITAQVGSTDAVDCFRSLSNDSSHLKVNVTILAAIFTVIAVIIQHL